MQPAPHELFSQLQARYPLACLITELVQGQEGQYIVRALVQMAGTTLATGMAAEGTIELAEDQARRRVLALLGVGVATATQATPAKPEAPSTIPLPKPYGAGATSLKDFPGLEPLPPLPSVEEIVPEAASLPTPKPKKAAKGLPKVEPQPLPEVTEDQIPDPPVESPLAAPIDLSDAIAQVGAEIQRIGWTKKQGSDYLLTTYGKRTRGDLNEDELLEFLEYLKQQPGAGAMPF